MNMSENRIKVPKNFVVDESSEEDDSNMEESTHGSSPIIERRHEIDPDGTTPELNSSNSPELFDLDERNNDMINKISVGTNTDNMNEMNPELNNLNLETIGKCYTLGYAIGRALTMMPNERRDNCIHQLLHCFETSDFQF